jgi:hypothetical protein
LRQFLEAICNSQNAEKGSASLIDWLLPQLGKEAAADPFEPLECRRGANLKFPCSNNARSATIRRRRFGHDNLIWASNLSWTEAALTTIGYSRVVPAIPI